MKKTIKATWKGGSLFQSTNPGGDLLINDGSESDELAYSPKMLMLTALAGCSGLDVVSLLKKMRAEVDEFYMDIEANQTDEHPKHYDKVLVTYNFVSSEFKKDKIEKAVKLSEEKYCGVMEMFRQFAEITVKINYIKNS